MKKFLILIFCFPGLLLAQTNQDKEVKSKNDTKVFKKRVLENTEINLLSSLYTQDGDNAAVTGGIGSEKLDNSASNISIVIPLNEDDILSIDATVSAYSSASSSNLNPFSGASIGGDDDDDEGDDDKDDDGGGSPVTGTPWVESSGASKSDTWVNAIIGYSHSSDDRNTTYDAHVGFANEFDYRSFGGGVGITKQFNKKNSELSIGTNLYFDTWRPEYPTEIKTFIQENGNLERDFFSNVPILDQNGTPIDKNSVNAWHPVNNTLIENKGRNTYTLSMAFSQILTKRAQLSIFSDLTYQSGWLANPMQRVYFSDIDNFYIGNGENIKNYTNYKNTDVFQLADDIERLPHSRIKIPLGIRLSYYISEFFVFKSYYRYYSDDWGVKSNTLSVELPIKIGGKFTVYPDYRYYNQTKSTYFAPYEQHLSTDEYYTSDYDLSAFTAHQFGFGIKYNDVFTSAHIWKIGLKDVNLNYHYYSRSTGLQAHIISLGTKIVIE